MKIVYRLLIVLLGFFFLSLGLSNVFSVVGEINVDENVLVIAFELIEPVGDDLIVYYEFGKISELNLRVKNIGAVDIHDFCATPSFGVKEIVKIPLDWNKNILVGETIDYKLLIVVNDKTNFVLSGASVVFSAGGYKVTKPIFLIPSGSGGFDLGDYLFASFTFFGLIRPVPFLSNVIALIVLVVVIFCFIFYFKK